MEFDLTKMAKKAIQNVISNTLYKGRSINDWINFIANNADDLISKQVAIKFIKDHSYPVRYDNNNSIEQGMTITGIEQALNELSTTQQEPSTTQQEPSTTQQEPSNEIQEILDYLDNTLHPIVSPNNWYVYAELYDMVSKLQSAQPANGNS